MQLGNLSKTNKDVEGNTEKSNINYFEALSAKPIDILYFRFAAVESKENVQNTFQRG